MANTSTGSQSKVIGSFDSTGSSDAITARGARLVDLAVDFTGGTYVGTIDLEWETETGASNAKEWTILESYTGDTFKIVRVATERRLRLTASVATSGEAFFEMTAGNRE
jgi:hypothetical protein